MVPYNGITGGGTYAGGVDYFTPDVTFTFAADTTTTNFQVTGTPAVAAVPEPGSVALLIGVTTTGAGFLSRRRRKQAQNAA